MTFVLCANHPLCKNLPRILLRRERGESYQEHFDGIAAFSDAEKLPELRLRPGQSNPTREVGCRELSWSVERSAGRRPAYRVRKSANKQDTPSEPEC